MRHDCQSGVVQIERRHRQCDGGYLLLAILLMMALMIIAASMVAPRVVQQIKRDREEEMIHRGTEYARAIKKFYKKNGRYPSSLDDLDHGQIRYLRKRYKDPLTKDGKWKLLNYGDIQMLLNSAAPGTAAASLASEGGTVTPGGAVVSGVPSPTPGSLSFAIQHQQQQLPGNTGGSTVPSSQGYQDPNIINLNSSASSGDNQVVSGDAQSTVDGQQNTSNDPFGNTNTNPQGTSPFGQNTAGGHQTFGGGVVVGVASVSKDSTIRIYNKKKTYNEWQFVYNPTMERANVLLRGPYQPTTIGGAQVGTPASQMNGQQQSGFGQPPNISGQQPTAPQQPIQPPGDNYPPDQSQQQ